jgi:hypothetical protein
LKKGEASPRRGWKAEYIENVSSVWREVHRNLTWKHVKALGAYPAFLISQERGLRAAV